MAFNIKVGDVQFGAASITALQFVSNTPNGREEAGDNNDGLKLGEFNYKVKPGGGNARSSDFGQGVKVWGRINFSGAGESWEDKTVKLAEWALLPSDSKDAYKKVIAMVMDGGHVVRQYTYDKAFVVEYSEELDDEAGMGRFYLHIRQKKDWNGSVQAQGGYAFKGTTS